jgi:hypothetical protein
MPGFYWTKVVWAPALLQLALRELQMLMIYSNKYKHCLQKTSISVFTAFFSSLRTNTTTITTATTIAAASGNGPLAPQMRPCPPRRHIKWMGDNPLSKQVEFIFWVVEGVYGP